MKHKKDRNPKLDKILKTALTLDIKPEEELNQHILEAWKENISMKKSGKRRVTIAVAAACMVLATGSVFAAAKYLKMTELADKSGIETMTVFSNEDVTEIYETKEAGEFRFTLLGIASGEVWVESYLSKQMPDLKGTYAAVAIERLDGKAMPSTSEDAYADMRFFISPLIAGLEPWQYNMASMNGGYTDFVEDGILYRLLECDDIVLFADRELYLCISDTVFYDTNAYRYDAESGKISRKEGYNGINLLFSLPVDPSKADRAAAEAYLSKLEESWHTDSEERVIKNGELEEEVTRLETLLGKGRVKEALEGFVAVGESVITPNADGAYYYEYSKEDECQVSCFYLDHFRNEHDHMILYTDFDEETNMYTGLCMVLLTDNKDGTVTAQTYKMVVQ